MCIGAMQCNIMTDILDLVKLCFAENFQREHLCTEVPAATWMLEPFREVGGDVPEYLSWEKIFQKWRGKKLSGKNSSKDFTAGV